MLAALEERARSGVRVRLIIDRYGSLLTPKRYFDSLIAAGGEVCWYQPIAWYTLKRLNNRTHRDVLVWMGGWRSSAASGSRTTGSDRASAGARGATP